MSWEGIAALIGVTTGLTGAVAGVIGLRQATKSNETADEALAVAKQADERETKRLAIDLEHRKVDWSIRYAPGRDDAIEVTQTGSTEARDVLVTVRANGWPTRRQEAGTVKPDDVVLVDLSEEHAAFRASNTSKLSIYGWSIVVEWRSPAGKPESFKYVRPQLER